MKKTRLKVEQDQEGSFANDLEEETTKTTGRHEVEGGDELERHRKTPTINER
jgi:hypothetical protein